MRNAALSAQMIMKTIIIMHFQYDIASLCPPSASPSEFHRPEFQPATPRGPASAARTGSARI